MLKCKCGKKTTDEIHILNAIKINGINVNLTQPVRIKISYNNISLNLKKKAIER